MIQGKVYFTAGEEGITITQHSQDPAKKKSLLPPSLTVPMGQRGAQKVAPEALKGNKLISFTAFTKLSQHLPEYSRYQPKEIQQRWPGCGTGQDDGCWGLGTGSIPGLYQKHLLCA